MKRIVSYETTTRDLKGVIEEMILLAQEYKETVKYEFNGFILVVTSTSKLEDIIKEYDEFFLLKSHFIDGWKKGMERAVERGEKISECAQRCAYNVSDAEGGMSLCGVYMAFHFIIRSNWKHACELQEWGKNGKDFMTPYFKK